MFHLVLPFFSYLRPIFDAIFPIVSSPGEPAEDGGLERARARRGSRRALAAELAQGGQDHVLAAGSRGGNPPVFDGFYMGTSRGFSEYGGLMLKFLKVGGHPNFFSYFDWFFQSIQLLGVPYLWKSAYHGRMWNGTSVTSELYDA